MTNSREPTWVRRRIKPWAAAIGLLFFWLVAPERCAAEPPPTTLEQQLLAETSAELAAAARSRGDARQGASLFHQPHLACIRCHVAGDQDNVLGPDLARLPPEVTAEHLVESLLAPSQSIRRGYEALVLELDDGQALTGFLVEENADTLTIRDVGQQGRRRSFPKSRIEARQSSPISVMPTGQVNLLADRQQFLDLVAYLIEIAEQGPERAVALRPAGAPLGPPPAAPDTSSSEPQVYRTLMPESGPASLAIGLGRGVWLCFDPQRGGVNYAWSGDLDLRPTVAQKINQPAIVEGRLFFGDALEGPLRVTHRDQIPRMRFRGYRFEDKGVTLRYQVDEIAVDEHLTAFPAGDGFVRRLHFEGPATTLWLLVGSQPDSQITVHPAQREGEAWRLDLNESATVTLRIQFAKEKP